MATPNPRKHKGRQSADFPQFTLREVYEQMSGNTVILPWVFDSHGSTVGRYSHAMAESYIDLVLENDPNWKPRRKKTTPRKRKNKKVTRSEYARKWREMLKPYDLKVRLTPTTDLTTAVELAGSIELAIFWDSLTWDEVDTLMGDSVAYLFYEPSSHTSTLAVGGKGFHMYPVYSKELLKEIVRFMGVSK